MSDQARVQSMVRISTVSGRVPFRRRLPALLWGQGPLYLVAFVTGGLLWGTGHDLPSVPPVVTGRADLRTGIAWLAFIAALLAVAYPLQVLIAEVIRGSRLRTVLTGKLSSRQQRRRDRLIAEYQEQHPGDDLVATEIALRFPLSGSALRPTALGNAEAAVADRVARRYYGLGLELVWPRLTPLVLESNQTSLVTTLAGAEHRADVALYSAAGWLVTAVWVLPCAWVVAQFGMDGSARLWAPLLFLALSDAAILFIYSNRYREAVDRTIARGKLVESAVDFYRLDLLDRLGFRRPKPGEEPQFFRALSAYLVGRPVDEKFRQEYATGDDSLQALTASVLGGVERGLDETVRRVLAGPELDNYEGHLSVELLDGTRAGPMNEDRKADLLSGHEYTLAVSIGPVRQANAATAPIRIRGGRDRPTVQFAVSIDSNVLALQLAEQPFPVDRETGGPPLEVAFRMSPHGPTSPWLWIRVTQHGRTIQNLDLGLIGEGGGA